MTTGISTTTRQGRHPAITAASILCFVFGVGWTPGVVSSLDYWIRHRALRTVDTPMGQIRGFAGPFEALGIDFMIAALVLFYITSLLGIPAGYWLWKSQRKGGILAISLLVLSTVFWFGFALPFPPIVGLLLAGLLAAGWKSLKGGTS